ncbi:hypothetical protein V5O48_000560 [Marasmius crinis-equi]|uniref:Cytochrome P450 n=1 Tax=Marasmius crinis-equi TaxID=585013 RepID=A0ABR3G135_9AGAR
MTATLPPPPYTSPSAVFFAVLFVLGFVFRSLRVKTRSYPPGPAGFPLVGNLFQAPKLRQWVKFLEWARRYGSIFHLAVGPQHVIVLNTIDAIEDLFVRQSRIFSERYAPHVAADIMSAGQRLIFIGGSTEEFKNVRKALHSTLSANSSRKLRPLQDLESRMTLYHLLMLSGENNANTKKPEGLNVVDRHWYSILNRFSTNVSVMAMYGSRLPDAFGSEKMLAIHQVSENVTHMALPGAFLADVFPLVRLLPDFLAPWRMRAKRLHEWESKLYGGFLSDIISDHKNGTNRPDCFVGSYIKNRAENGLEEAPGKGITSDGWILDMLLAYSAGNVLEAGSDTTACTLKIALLFLVNYPQVLQKARDEVDAICGDDRLPAFEDEASLPYLLAVIKEGYFIPKGSTVIANAYALHMDPLRFPEPTKFKPERWFAGKDDMKSMKWGSGPEHPRDHYLFGWGRRFCPGSHIAEASLFIILSRYIWAFEFRTTGKPPNPWDEESYTGGFVTNPHRFEVSFVPRTERHAEVIRGSFEDAQEQWEILGMERDRV